MIDESTPATTSDTTHPGYLFVDNVRFLSMIAIVMRHCELSLFEWSSVPALESAIIQFRTFGVQLFFVASAFLMADRLARRNWDIRGYWTSRLRQVLIPWLIWVSIYIALDLFIFFVRPHSASTGIVERVFGSIFYQSFWYVPILLFSIAIFLLFRRYWGSPWLGLALGLLSLFYGINQYALWIPPGHTVAFFGYLFPLWVGVQLFENFDVVSGWLKKVPWWGMLALLCLTFGLTLAEDRAMKDLGFADTYNALQITNQLYSFVVLIVLIKLPVCLFPSFVDVRKDTYGIYLLHQIVARVGRGGIDLIAGPSESGETLFMRLPRLVQDPLVRESLWLVWTLFVYAVSLLITKLIRRSPLDWVVGVRDWQRSHLAPPRRGKTAAT